MGYVGPLLDLYFDLKKIGHFKAIAGAGLFAYIL